jgi:hypothetical protein
MVKIKAQLPKGDRRARAPLDAELHIRRYPPLSRPPYDLKKGSGFFEKVMLEQRDGMVRRPKVMRM